MHEGGSERVTVATDRVRVRRRRRRIKNRIEYLCESIEIELDHKRVSKKNRSVDIVHRQRTVRSVLA